MTTQTIATTHTRITNFTFIVTNVTPNGSNGYWQMIGIETNTVNVTGPTYSTNGAVWTPIYLDLNAASNSLVTGLATITNLHYPTNGVLRESHPFALSNRVTLKVTNAELLRAFYGPKDQ